MNLNSISPTAAITPRISVTKYGARFWAVWIDGDLAVVAVYRKGARRVAELLTNGAINDTDANVSPP